MFGIGWNVQKDECEENRKKSEALRQSLEMDYMLKDVPFMLHFACINAGLPGQADTEA